MKEMRTRLRTAGTGRSNIQVSYAGGMNAGKGFNISWDFNGGLSDATVGSSFVSNQRIIDLLSTAGPQGRSLSGAASAAALLASLDGPLPVADMIATGLLAAAIATYFTQTNFITYTLTNSAGKVYSGKSSGLGNPYGIMMRRYAGHHMRKKGYSQPQLDVYAIGILAPDAISGREQQLIDFWGGVGSPNVGNSIRAVSRLNPAGYLYWQQSNLLFGNIAPFTGFFGGLFF